MKSSRLFRSLPLVLLFLALTFLPLLSFAEEEGGGEAGGHSVMHMILSGGAGVVTVWVVILITSMIMLTLIIQNVIELRVSKLAPPALIDVLRQQISSGNYQEAWVTCGANKNYVANVLKAGLYRLGQGKTSMEDALTTQALREASLLRTRNSYLSVIGVVAPMIGLLGTVIGMMGAFAVLSGSGFDPRALSGKIGEVLMATATGIGIAIPAFVSYYLFRNISQTCIVHADDVVSALVEDINHDEIHGMKIGENFSPGAPLGGARKMSVAFSTACPVCNGGVEAGVNPCPHCGSTLDWAA